MGGRAAENREWGRTNEGVGGRVRRRRERRQIVGKGEGMRGKGERIQLRAKKKTNYIFIVLT